MNCQQTIMAGFCYTQDIAHPPDAFSSIGCVYAGGSLICNYDGNGSPISGNPGTVPLQAISPATPTPDVNSACYRDSDAYGHRHAQRHADG